MEGAASRSKDHTKSYMEAKTWSRPEGQGEKSKRGVRRRLLQLTLFTKEETAREVDEAACC